MTPPVVETEIHPESFSPVSRRDFLDVFRNVRRNSNTICSPLETEDYVIQTMDDVSPPKWHLAHTTWFFETFLLEPHLAGYESFHPQYCFLFNSYYEAVGERHPRPRRGLLSRPTVKEVYDYRTHVDRHMGLLIEQADDALWHRIGPLVDLGINHEEQHQELLITDIKHILAENPLRPVYSPGVPLVHSREAQRDWITSAGGITEIGFGGSGFHFDNEGPRHLVYVQPHRLASHLVTNGEYLEFIKAGRAGRNGCVRNTMGISRVSRIWRSKSEILGSGMASSGATASITLQRRRRGWSPCLAGLLIPIGAPPRATALWGYWVRPRLARQFSP